MCLAIPGKIIEIKKNNHAIVDYGEGTRRQANISLVDADLGDYILVHAGFAIQKINKKEAMKTLKLFKKTVESGG